MCNFVRKWKECIQILVNALTHNEENQKKNRGINIELNVQKLI